MKRTRHLVVCLACIGALAPTESPALENEGDVPEAGDCNLEAALERKRRRGQPSERQSSLRLACGIGWRTELEAAIARRHGSGTRDESIALEAKTALRERENGGIGWTLALGVEGERSNGSGWRRSEQSVAVEASAEPLRDWRIEAKLGAARETLAHIDKTLWSLAIERAIGERIELSVKLDGDDRSRPLASLGLRWALWPERAVLKLSYGAIAGPQRERRSSIAIKVEL
jgi:hypothetical protein